VSDFVRSKGYPLSLPVEKIIETFGSRRDPSTSRPGRARTFAAKQTTVLLSQSSHTANEGRDDVLEESRLTSRQMGYDKTGLIREEEEKRRRRGEGRVRTEARQRHRSPSNSSWGTVDTYYCGKKGAGDYLGYRSQHGRWPEITPSWSATWDRKADREAVVTVYFRTEQNVLRGSGCGLSIEKKRVWHEKGIAGVGGVRGSVHAFHERFKLTAEPYVPSANACTGGQR